MKKIKSPAAKGFIGQLEQLAQKTEELSALCPHVKGSGASKQLKLLAQKLYDLPESELIAAHDMLKDMPCWQQLPQGMDEVIDKVKNSGIKPSYECCNNTSKQGTAGKAKAKGYEVQANIAAPSVVIKALANCTLGSCPSGPSQVEVDNLLIAVAASDLLKAGAQLVADIAKIVSELVGNVLQAIASGIDVVTKTLALAASIQQRAADVVAECEDTAVKNLLLSMCNTLNGIDSKMDDALGKLDEINKKLDEVLKIVKEIKDIVDEILLHQIEEALSECKLLVDLYLPEIALGSLLKVQNIVEKLISNSKFAGLDTANAQAYWRQGVAALASGQYERALQWFMLSYKQLQSKDICSVPCPSNPCCE